MKECLCCGLHAATTFLTCPACGEGAWQTLPVSSTSSHKSAIQPVSSTSSYKSEIQTEQDQEQVENSKNRRSRRGFE